MKHLQGQLNNIQCRVKGLCLGSDYAANSLAQLCSLLLLYPPRGDHGSSSLLLHHSLVQALWQEDQHNDKQQCDEYDIRRCEDNDSIFHVSLAAFSGASGKACPEWHSTQSSVPGRFPEYGVCASWAAALLTRCFAVSVRL